MRYLNLAPAQNLALDKTMANRKLNIVSLVMAFFMVTSTSLLAQESSPPSQGKTNSPAWSSFRNGGLSHVPKDASFPTSWSPSHGISWQVELAGYGQSAPLVLDDKILVTAVDGPKKETNLVICIDRETGIENWRASQPSTLLGSSNYMYSRAAPTPIADEQRTIAFFESGDLIAVRTSDGTKLWERDLKQDVGELKSRHGLGSSLTQTDDLFFVNLEHGGPSALIAIQKSDGATRWSVERPSGSSWSSPVVMRRGDEFQVVISSAGEAAGYDSQTGKELWKITDLAGNSVPSPLILGNRIFLGARKSEFGSVAAAAQSNLCLEFLEDDVSPTVVWRSERCVADYCSPVVSGDFLFLINGSGILGCLNKNNGEEKYRQRLGFESWATPIVRGDQLFVFGKNGTTSVIQADGEYKLISENRLWDTDNPPSPVSYQEYYPPTKATGHGTGDHKGHNGKHSSGSKPTAGSRGHSAQRDSKNPGAGMLAGMLKGDKDGDETLTGDEIPKRLVAVMDNIDLNKDGSLDKSELEKMAKSFAKRRAGSKQSSRDPIVYGVAADSEGILIRTGTRLYAIGGESKK